MARRTRKTKRTRSQRCDAGKAHRTEADALHGDFAILANKKKAKFNMRINPQLLDVLKYTDEQLKKHGKNLTVTGIINYLLLDFFKTNSYKDLLLMINNEPHDETLILKYNLLNEDGKAKVLEYIDDISQKYQD